MKKLINIQFYILLVGTVFAWSNFFIELFDWMNNQACTTGCSASGEVVNPFFTPCFYGAIFFALAFIVSIMMMIKGRKGKKEEAQPQKPKEETADGNISRPTE